MVAPIGAHASILMSLRAKNLQAYGIDPKALTIQEDRHLMTLSDSPTRALAKSKREERALAIQEDHTLMGI